MERMDKLNGLLDKLAEHTTLLVLLKHFVGYLAIAFVVMLAAGVMLELFHRRK